MDWYFVGVDFGQTNDFTAGFAVVERAERTGRWDAVKFAWRKVVTLQLRYLERVPLGTPYTEVVEASGASDAVAGAGRPVPAGVDGTGGGQAGGGSAECRAPGCVVMAVNITSGLKQTSRAVTTGSRSAI